ncbi:hypothetical protein [Nocardia mexicana]|uniref:Uncharacterized protein n=1 Tax=Nocardia mexicana TaxID=279262 RepID=A0A370HFC3_9NOCA|nr:hypothetical protein [Nocardia mexicana]RDI55931.1 hypothetical protein DFR68_101768 [Nocardia mexicana]
MPDNAFSDLAERQRRNLRTDLTKTAEWRLDQLDRMERMLLEHADEWRAALRGDFGKPSFEQQF